VAPLEPWQKVLIDTENYSDDVHSYIPCQDCHEGEQSSDKTDAHDGLQPHPSEDPARACGDCHPDVLASHDTNLHANLDGYWTVLDARSEPEDHENLEGMFSNHCNDCHATCGECHVSQPRLVGSGFIDGHVFNETPSMTRNCTACHGSRVGNEYLGKHEGVNPDVHFRQGRMSCVDCHTGDAMHGEPDQCESCHEGPEAESIAPPDHRYDGAQVPSCESCHMTVALGQDEYEMHTAHSGDLSCQVCHSAEYTSCDGCHVEVSETTGNPFFKTDDSYLQVMIGKNPRQSYDRPYDYVTLRHVPIAHDSFEFYGDDLLKNFDALPTWTYTTPHNIQRITPQAETCESCHGNADLFLTADKVDPVELEANRDVIMDMIPGDDGVLIEYLIEEETEIEAEAE